MSEIEFYYYIRSDLPACPQSPASLGAKFVDTLDALSHLDPTIFKNWEVMDFAARILSRWRKRGVALARSSKGT